jgi:parallel beta-helix repeat protein
MIYRNLIADCSGPCAIFLYVNSNAQVINNTVCDNTWGGISIQAGSNAFVKNNIFCNNVDYGIHVASGSSWYVGYNDVFGQNKNYCENIGDQTGIEGNISADPLFVDPSAGDYHLLPGSPCVDAGHPPGVDIGAFESSFRGLAGDQALPQSFTLFQNYPNPFNPHTQIGYLLLDDRQVKITVFNSLGQRVKVLVDGHQTAGRKNVRWDGRDEQGKAVASGVYLCRMEVADITQTKKMLLVK